MIRRSSAAITCLLIFSSPPGAHAQDTRSEGFEGRPYWEAVIGPFAIHWSNEEDHKHVYLLGIERSLPEAPAWSKADSTIWGLSAFNNSFGQPSAYAYYGWRWDNLFDNPALYLKLSGGILYGYKEPYEDKVPFNHNGFGLAIIPAVGYRVTRQDAIQIGTLGTAGLIFTYNRRF